MVKIAKLSTPLLCNSMLVKFGQGKHYVTVYSKLELYCIQENSWISENKIRHEYVIMTLLSVHFSTFCNNMNSNAKFYSRTRTSPTRTPIPRAPEENFPGGSTGIFHQIWGSNLKIWRLRSVCMVKIRKFHRPGGADPTLPISACAPEMRWHLKKYLR